MQRCLKCRDNRHGPLLISQVTREEGKVNIARYKEGLHNTAVIDYPQCDSLRLMASTRVKEVMHLDSALKHHERGQLIYKSRGLRNVIHLV